MNIILEAIWKHFKKHYGKLNNPVQKNEYVLYNAICVKFQDRQHQAMLTESLSVVA